MDRLRAGVRSFYERIFPKQREHFEALAQGQKPRALVVTCSDSRIDPALLTGTSPGEIFVLRNAGNLVPPYGGPAGGESATIEYALRVLKVAHVIVCGHSHCGAMAAVLDGGPGEALPEVEAWLAHARPALERVCEPSLGDPLLDVVAANVKLQLDQLRTHPAVAEAEASGAVTLHGWIYRFETGEVLELAADGSFRSLAGRAGGSEEAA